MATSKSPYFFGQPLNNPVERTALQGAVYENLPWYEQAMQAVFSPTSVLAGGISTDRSFAAMEQNEKVLEQLKAAGIPVTTDRYGNYIPAGGSNGLLASFGRSLGFNGGGGSGGGGLLGLFGGDSAPAPAPQHYGGYVRDANNNPIRGGDGFVTYGSGPQGNLEVFGDNEMGTI